MRLRTITATAVAAVSSSGTMLWHDAAVSVTTRIDGSGRALSRGVQGPPTNRHRPRSTHGSVPTAPYYPFFFFA